MRTAKFFSYFFHPLLMPTYGMLLIPFFFPVTYFLIRGPVYMYALSVIVLSTFLLPTLVSLILLRSGLISSLEMSQRNERNIPLLVTAVFYALGFYAVGRAPIPPELLLVIIGVNSTVVITLIINFFWKISAHMAGIGGITGMTFFISAAHSEPNTILFAALILVAGIIGSSRLKLKAHSPAQVYSGFLLGFLCQGALFLMA